MMFAEPAAQRAPSIPPDEASLAKADPRPVGGKCRADDSPSDAAPARRCVLAPSEEVSGSDRFRGVLSACPREVLTYDVGNPASETRAPLKLQNLSDRAVLFKVKMTDPFLLRAHPAIGRLFPKETVEIRTSLMKGIDARNEMFLIQVFLLEDSEVDASSLLDLWQTILKSSRRNSILSHKLLVHVVGNYEARASHVKTRSASPAPSKAVGSAEKDAYDTQDKTGDGKELGVFSTSVTTMHEGDFMIALASTVESLCGAGWRISTLEIRLGSLTAPLSAASMTCAATARELQSLKDNFKQYTVSFVKSGLDLQCQFLKEEYKEHALKCSAGVHDLRIQNLKLAAVLSTMSWRLNVIRRRIPLKGQHPSSRRDSGNNFNSNAYVGKNRVTRIEAKQRLLRRYTDRVQANAKLLTSKTDAMSDLVKKVYSGLKQRRQELNSDLYRTYAAAGQNMVQEQHAVVRVPQRLASTIKSCEEVVRGIKNEQEAVTDLSKTTSEECKMAKQYLATLSEGVFEEHQHILRDSHCAREHIISQDGHQTEMNGYLIQIHQELKAAFGISKRLVSRTNKTITEINEYQLEVASDLSRLHQEARAQQRQEKDKDEAVFGEIQERVAEIVGQVKGASRGLRYSKDRIGEVAKDLLQLTNQTQEEINFLENGLQHTSKRFRKEVQRCNEAAQSKIDELLKNAVIIEGYLKTAEADADKLHADFQEENERFSGFINKMRTDIFRLSRHNIKDVEQALDDLRTNVVEAIRKLAAMVDAAPDIRAGEDSARAKLGTEARRLAHEIRALEVRATTTAALQDDEDALVHEEVEQKLHDITKEHQTLASLEKALSQQQLNMDAKAREEIETFQNEMEASRIKQFNQSNNTRERISALLKESRASDQKALFGAKQRIIKRLKDDVDASTKEDIDAIHALLQELSKKMGIIKKRAASAEKAAEWIFYFEMVLTVAMCIFIYYACSVSRGFESRGDDAEYTWLDLLLSVLYS